MDPDNPLYGRLDFPVHEEQVPAALNQSDQAEAQGPRPPFSQVAHSTAGQAAPFHHAQCASWQEELQTPYHQPNAAQAAPFHHAQAAPVHYGHAAPSQEQPQVPHPRVAQVAQPTAAQAAPLHYHYGQASPGQEWPQVSFPVVTQVAQPAIAPSTLLHGQAGPGEPALAQPQVPQPGAFAQAAVVQPGQRQRSRASSRAPQIQRQKENRQANAAELVSQSPSLPELESHEHLLIENIMQ